MILQNINRCVFTGDTLFIGGTGSWQEGTAYDWLASMDIFLALPDDTKIFCGHERTLANLDFCKKVEGKTNRNIANCK